MSGEGESGMGVGRGRGGEGGEGTASSDETRQGDGQHSPLYQTVTGKGVQLGQQLHFVDIDLVVSVLAFLCLDRSKSTK